MADAQVLQLPPGSLLVLRDVRIGDTDDGEPGIVALMEALMHAAGHNRFAVLQVEGDATVEVWGPDDDLVAKVRGLLTAERHAHVAQEDTAAGARPRPPGYDRSRATGRPRGVG